MKIQVLGVGDAFTSKYYNTSFLVQSERLFLLDCPPGLLRLLAARQIDPFSINDVVLTHIHGDHSAGLETLLLWKKYVQRTRVRLWTSALVYREVREKLFPSFADTFVPAMDRIVRTDLNDYAEFRELREGEKNRLDERFEVDLRYNWHPTPTLGLRLISPLGTIGISGDTCYDLQLLDALLEKGAIDAERYRKLTGDWLWHCDLIYHEVARGLAGPHTSEAALLSLPPETRRKIRLIHVADNFTEGEIPMAREGEVASFTAPGQVSVRSEETNC
jgi:hypothetical protein